MKQLASLKNELKKLERQLAEFQHQNALGSALQLLPKVQDLRSRIAKLEAQR
jgi:hypothetical protein